ncbi:MAG: tRNA (adenosine(37)-N6)-threonylcarbamoyltransferase complex ATPase subunit type 1 TsaE [Phycisphaerales bacterium]|nr:MAG: tRNA (adenosine(37)-N6)-threonylcarbamoyltransferase complex ATPase subunit type 1 TsaE [Phycisphaerales bacterium]
MTSSADRFVCKTDSPEATITLGEAIGCSLIGGLVIGLVGPLGAGKTQLVKGIASGNSIDDTRDVTSPTFVLVNEYAGRLDLYHLDAYRLSTPKEFLALGFDEFIHGGSAVVVEWADRVHDAMPEGTLWIDIAVTGETAREFSFRSSGVLAGRALQAFRQELERCSP